MSNEQELIPKFYFEDALQFVGRRQFGRLKDYLQETMQQILPFPNVCAYALKKLAETMMKTDNCYTMLKLLLVAHTFFSHADIGKQYMLDVLSMIQLEQIDAKTRFERFLVGGFVKNYIDYLKRICACCSVYIHCHFSKGQDNPQLYFFGCLNLARYSWPLLAELEKMEPILHSTYPFLLDIYAAIGKDASVITTKIHKLWMQLSQSSNPLDQEAWQLAQDRLLQLKDSSETAFCNQFLREEIQLPTLVDISFPDDTFSRQMRQFMSSEQKAFKSTSQDTTT